MEIKIIKVEITEHIKDITDYFEKTKCSNIIFIKNICSNYQNNDMQEEDYQEINDHLSKELECGFFTCYEYILVEKLWHLSNSLILAIKLKNRAI